MLRSASLRWKILAILVLPTLIIAGLALTLIKRSGNGQETTLLALVAMVAVLIPIAQGLILARRITEPLRRLTASAQGVSAELPALVERAHATGEGPPPAFSPLPVRGNDEIGRVATAFNAVNDTTLRVITEQVALRGSIATMYVNVARRNQALLGRQLHVLERLEAREADEDALADLFDVDHLTTRMQRNAESLLVLAGVEASRRSRQPLALSDVLRTAVGEIEQYARVDLKPGIDPEVEARHVMVAAHLLAELLENATRFSAPESRVEVHVIGTPAGVNVVVVDHGLGMSAADLAHANHMIAEPPAAELAVSDRLGFVVVGRLARRLGAAVRLYPGEPGGVVAVLSLPVPVFRDAAPRVEYRQPGHRDQHQPDQHQPDQHQPDQHQPDQHREPVGARRREPDGSSPHGAQPPQKPQAPQEPQEQPLQEPQAHRWIPAQHAVPVQAPLHEDLPLGALPAPLPSPVTNGGGPSDSALAMRQLRAYQAEGPGSCVRARLVPAAADAPQRRAEVVPGVAPMPGELPAPVIPPVAPAAPVPGEPGGAAAYRPTFSEPSPSATLTELSRRSPRPEGAAGAGSPVHDPLAAAFGDLEPEADGQRDPKTVQGNLSSFRTAVQRARADASVARCAGEPRT